MSIRMPETIEEGINLFGDRRKLPLKPEEFIKRFLQVKGTFPILL